MQDLDFVQCAALVNTNHGIVNLIMNAYSGEGHTVDFKTYDKKWTIHGIIQNMQFHPTKANSCVMMRDNSRQNLVNI